MFPVHKRIIHKENIMGNMTQEGQKGGGPTRTLRMLFSSNAFW